MFKSKLKARLSLRFGCILLLSLLCVSATMAVDLKQATYPGLTNDEFLKKWLVTEPIPVFPGTVEKKDADAQKQVFETRLPDFNTLIPQIDQGKLALDGQFYKWKKIQSKKNEIDLIDIFGQHDFVYVYALARVEMTDSASYLMGLGSDDGVMLWLNGQLVHQNWIGRPVQTDADLIQLHFKKGANLLLLKIQNMEHGWGFTLRPLGEKTLPDMLMQNARAGRLDEIKLLFQNGVNLNSQVEPGVTALHLAKIRGQQQVADWLLAHGADASIPMPTREKMADHLFQRAIKKDYPGASVLVARDGNILYERGWGLANIKKQIPITPQTTFRIGSITKQFTAAAILRLQEQGRISVNDPLSKYLPDFPEAQTVTIRHLLQHTSGIQSYTSVPDFLKDVSKPIRPEDLVQKISKLGSIFKPGENWSYNNSGFFLLGYLVEKLSGLSYQKFLQQEFFTPLAMNQTGVYTKGLALPAEAIGYTYESDKVKLAMDWDMSHAGGAGNLYSNVDDLYRWNEAIFNGKVLSDSSFRMAMTPAKLNNGEIANAMGASYGFGWGLADFRGCKSVEHGGGLHGFNAQLSRLPEKKVTVIVLSNCLNNLPQLNPGTLARDLLEVFLWEELATKAANVVVQLSPAQLKAFVGRYDYGQSGILEVTQTDNRLFAQLTGQPRFEIFPRSENEFFWKVVEASVEFIKDAQGQVTHAMHQQGGGTLKALRLQEKVIVSVDPKIYQAYVGKYEIQPGMIMTISTEGNQLWTQVTGQPKFELFPESETDFFLKVVNAQLHFVRDEKGVVTKLLLNQSGMQFEARKTD
ncbi:serine hydrolase [candidate division KSB1 bacterium]|nr:serine hydrolase [candidate division KSB1 bacterium]